MPTRMSTDDFARLYDRVDSPTRYNVVLFDQLGPPLPKTWLVDGVLADGEFTAVYGEPGSGKGNFALDLALHVATGRPWNGRRTSRAGVLYIALERREQVARRVQAFVRHHGVPTRHFLDFNLAISSDPIDLREADSLTRAWLAARWELFEDAEDEDLPELGLIVIDTFARAIGSGSDSNEQDQNAVAAAVEAFTRETGCAVLIIHHSPVGGEPRLRGHGALYGALDKTVLVRRYRGHFLAKTQKDNDEHPDNRLSFEFDTQSVTLLTADDGTRTTAPIVVPLVPVSTPAFANQNERTPRLSPSNQAVLDSLVGLGEASTEAKWRAAADETAGQVGASAKRKRFTRALSALHIAGLVEFDGQLYRPKRDTGQNGTKDNSASCPSPLSKSGTTGQDNPSLL